MDDRIIAIADQWAERARYDAGETEPDACEACDGEAVDPAVMAAHEQRCDYLAHDVLDDGGGPCPGCPACNGAGLAIRCLGHGTLLGQHEPELLAALEPLTWIGDRLPKVGDRITVRHAFGDREHFTGVVLEIDRGQVHVSGWWSSLGDGWRYA